MQKKKIFWVVGEKSGENIACSIIKEMLDDTLSKIEMSGIIGENMKKLGVKEIFSTSCVAVMGLFEILPKLRKILHIISKTANLICKEKPDIVISIDSYDLCIRIARKVYDKNPNIRFVHIVAPSVWAYNQSRARKMSLYYKKLFCILPFEVKYFTKYNLDAEFIGNPAIYNIQSEMNNLPELPKDKHLIAITLGSRVSEIKRHVPIIKEIMQMFKVDSSDNINSETKFKFADLDLEFAILLNMQENAEIVEFVRNGLHLSKKQIIIDKSERFMKIKQAKFALAKSGTNTLEFLVAKTPIITYYKVSFMTYKIAKMFVKVKFIQLINIIAKKEIVPEFIQHNATAKNIYNKMIEYLLDESKCQQQIEESNAYISQMLSPDKRYTPSQIVMQYIKNVLVV